MTVQPDFEQPEITPPGLDPFDDSQVDGLFFPGAGRQSSLDQLLHLIRYGPSLLVLDGDEGVGKQFLVRRLFTMLDQELFDLALIQANVLNTPEAIYAVLSAAWHCRQELSVENRQQVLAATAQAADNESKTLLAIVHQAQKLSAESCLLIRELLSISAGLPVKFLMVVDAVELESAGPVFELARQTPDHFQMTLFPLNQEEIREYLNYRLRTAGLGKVRFNEEQIKSIYHQSLGNIQRINQIAAPLLNTSMPSPRVREPVTAKSPMPLMHLAALALVAVLLLVLFFVRTPGEPDRKPAEIEALSPEVETAAPEPDSAQTTNREKGGQEKGVSEPGNPEFTEPEGTESVVVETIQPEQETVEQSRTPAVQPETQSATEQVKESGVNGEKVGVEPVVSKTAPKPDPEPAFESQSISLTPPATSSVDQTAWVKSLPADRYLAQLLGARERGTVDTFLKRHSNVNNLAYYRVAWRGAPWFVVVQGSYASHEEATAAVSRLPQVIQKQGPWIRKVEAIQKELDN